MEFDSETMAAYTETLSFYNEEIERDSGSLGCDSRSKESYIGTMESDSETMTAYTEIMSSYIEEMECDNGLLRIDKCKMSVKKV
jgi:hypothetical protein